MPPPKLNSDRTDPFVMSSNATVPGIVQAHKTPPNSVVRNDSVGFRSGFTRAATEE